MAQEQPRERDIIFLSVSAFDDLSKQEQDFLAARMGDPLFSRFIDGQLSAASKQRDELNPDENITDVDFRRLSREYYLVWRFWKDFQDFSQAWIARSQQRQS
jgi:hypothetical protein